MKFYDIKGTKRPCLYLSIRECFFSFTFSILYFDDLLPDDSLYKENGFDMLGKIPLPDTLTSNICEALSKYKDISVIWDAREISHTKHRLYGDMILKLVADRNIDIFLLAIPDELELAKGQNNDIAYESDVILEDNGFSIHSTAFFPQNFTANDRESITSDINIALRNLNGIDGVIKRPIFDAIKESADKIANREENIPLKSSNIFANSYFNCKKVFYSNELFQHVVYLLAKLISENISDKHSFSSFICASLNGYAIATALAFVLQKKLIFIDNLGPIPLLNGNGLQRIKDDAKCIYIFDFMCLGSEFDRVNMVCKLKKSKLVFAAGISHYKKASIDDRQGQGLAIETLFGINDFQSDYYKCYFNRFDEIATKER